MTANRNLTPRQKLDRGRMSREPIRPLAGLLARPCGAWVHLGRMRSGLPWARPLGAMTRRGVLGGINGRTH